MTVPLFPAGEWMDTALMGMHARSFRESAKPHSEALIALVSVRPGDGGGISDRHRQAGRGVFPERDAFESKCLQVLTNPAIGP